MHTGSSTWRPLAMLGGFVSACMLATSTVTIEPGDTLSQIAREHRVSVADLVAWNGLDDPDRIIAGNTLLLASPTQEAASVDRPARYTIAPGDTLSAVAARLLIREKPERSAKPTAPRSSPSGTDRPLAIAANRCRRQT